MTEPDPKPKAAPETQNAPEAKDALDRSGDPLAGLYTWRDHPAARVGFFVAGALGLLLLLPIIAQWTF